MAVLAPVAIRPKNSLGWRREPGQVRAALAQLPAAQRAALALAYGGGYSQAQIARAQGVPLGTVKGRVRLGLRTLRRQLQGPAGLRGPALR